MRSSWHTDRSVPSLPCAVVCTFPPVASRLAGIKVQIGYKRRLGKYGGKPSVVVDNTLNRQFDMYAPDRFWGTDITYTKTDEGYSVLPNWAMAKDIEAGRLRVLDLEDGPLSINGSAKNSIYLLYHPPKFRLQKIRGPVDFLLAELRRDPSKI